MKDKQVNEDTERGKGGFGSTGKCGAVMGMFEKVLADMRERASVARASAKNNPDGTVHHEAVADMLEHLAARAEEAHKREIAAKDAEIDKLKFDNLHLKSVQRQAGEVIIEQTNKVEARDEEIAKLRSLVKELADGLSRVMKVSNPWDGKGSKK